MTRFHIHAACTLVLAVMCALSPAHGQSVPEAAVEAPEGASSTTLQGIVRDSLNRPVAGVTVRLQAKDAQISTAHTDSAGVYLFSALPQGVYTLRAQMPGYADATSGPLVLSLESRTVDLTLGSGKGALPRDASGTQPEFFDEPHFTVAGVTDTTNLGGHGSSATVRNRDELARAIASLNKISGDVRLNSSVAAGEKSLRESVVREPKSFDANYRLGKFLVEQGKAREALPYLEEASQVNPRDFDNAYELGLAYADTGDYEHARSDARSLLTTRDKTQQEQAELHHLLADVDEKLGDPLEAVREYQRAADLNPSEVNLFDWGAELLLHHATEPAIEVFTKGNHLFPRSVRLLVGLGASWYSNGSYDQAAQRFCEASDVSPDDPNPYLFMGRIQAAETTSSPAINQQLARFVRLQPQNPWANYYYAVSLQKRRKTPEDVEDLNQVMSLLQTAIHLDPKLGLAYLQLGIVYSEQRDFSEAILAYQSAIAATPTLEEAHYRLARAYKQAGEPSKAHAEMQAYEDISKEQEQEIERRRHELQQFVYQLRNPSAAAQPQ